MITLEQVPVIKSMANKLLHDRMITQERHAEVLAYLNQIERQQKPKAPDEEALKQARNNLLNRHKLQFA